MSKSIIFVSPMAFKFGGWPWKTIGHLLYACYFKLYASFRSHLWIQTGDPIWVEMNDFCFVVWAWNLTDDLENQWDTSPKQHQALCIISSPYMKSNWSYGPETLIWVLASANLDFWPLTLNFCIEITSVIGNHSWKFHDDTMMGT